MKFNLKNRGLCCDYTRSNSLLQAVLGTGFLDLAPVACPPFYLCFLWDFRTSFPVFGSCEIFDQVSRPIYKLKAHKFWVTGDARSNNMYVCAVCTEEIYCIHITCASKGQQFYFLQSMCLLDNNKLLFTGIIHNNVMFFYNKYNIYIYLLFNYLFIYLSNKNIRPLFFPL